MTQEEKDLLLKDLCGRLPYGVIIQEYNEEYGYSDNALNTIGIGYFSIHEACIEGTWINHIENIKPYLRPMESMTDEEIKEFQAFHCVDGSHPEFHLAMCNLPNINNMIGWLDRKMFDHRGLIPMGIALPAPEGMYK
jgi:hypothetical protein